MYGPHTLLGLQQDMVYGTNIMVHVFLKALRIGLIGGIGQLISILTLPEPIAPVPRASADASKMAEASRSSPDQSIRMRRYIPIHITYMKTTYLPTYIHT